MDFSSLESAVYGDVEHDEELMKELLALEAEERGAKQSATTSTKSSSSGQIKKQQQLPHLLPVTHATNTRAAALSPADLAKALADVPDSDVLDDDAEIDDPELLDELSNLVEEECGEAPKESSSLSAPAPTVDVVLLQRLHQLANDYSSAISRSEGNGPKIRRLQRGLDKIKDLTKKVEMGRSISEDEIPPKIHATASVTANQKLETLASSELPGATEKNDGHELPVRQAPAPPLPPRKNVPPGSTASAATASPVDSSMPTQERCAGKDSPSPQKQRAIEKEQPVENCASEATVDGSRILNAEQIMTLLKSRREAYIKNAQVANAAGDKKAAYNYYTVVKQFDEAIDAVESGQVTECSEDELPPAPESYRPPKKAVVPPPPKTLLEGLQQRLAKYRELCEQNKQEHNDRKFRMNSRIVKQYEDAIRAHQSKRPVNLEDLPCPPGYPALPVAEVQSSGANAKPLPSSHSSVVGGGQPGVKMSRAHQVGPLAPVLQPSSGPKIQSRQNQQLEFLLKRQQQFKQAALIAKNKNDMALAKKYLLAAKGFDQMIEASRAGLPVDIKKAPIPPQMQTSEQMLKPSLGPKSSLDSSAIVEGSREDVFKELERDLIRQIKICEENRLAFTKLGDVTRVNQFEKWSSDSKKDLILLRQMAKGGSSLPKVKFETRVFPSVDVCPEINEDHLELRIMRVLNVKMPSGWKPSDGNIFVRYEFTFPHDSHQNGKTKIIYGTNSPDFNEKFLLNINRKSKQLQRVIRRNCIKFEVYQKGGFLRSDRLLGSADCKLIALEAKARLHESVDLLEGRKPTGGKLEYEVRVREPLGETKLNFAEEKWLVLES